MSNEQLPMSQKSGSFINTSLHLNQEAEVRGMVYSACGKFVSLRDGVVTFTDTLTKEIFKMKIENVSGPAVRDVLETARAKKDRSFRMTVVFADALMFITRMHNVPKGIVMKASIAAVDVVMKHLRGESVNEE